MRRDICRHTDCDTGSSVYQKVWKLRRKNRRLRLGIVEVRHKINQAFFEIAEHGHSGRRELRLGVSHRSRRIPVYRSEVSMSVNKRRIERIVLCHMHQRIVYRAVSVRMVFTHRITDDTGTFSVWRIRRQPELVHSVEYPSLNRLQSVSDIRKCPGYDNADRIISVACLHLLRKIKLYDIIFCFL